MTAPPEFTTSGGLRVVLIHLILTGGEPDPKTRAARLDPYGDGWQFRVTAPNGVYLGSTRDLGGLAALGVDMADPALAAAVLDQPPIASMLGMDPAAITPEPARLADEML
jgi:hypothetical protein